MGENVAVSYVNTHEYRTSTENKRNTNKVHIELINSRGNIYESLNKQNAHTEEYETIKRPAKLENDASRSTTGKISLKVIVYILFAVVVLISLLSVAGFAVVLNKASSQSDRIDKIEARDAANQIQINKTVKQNAVTTLEGQRVAFTATGVNGSNPLIFPDIIYNYGDSYNNRSGKFTCFKPGIYYFASTLTKTFASDIDSVDCYIHVNSNVVIGTMQDPFNTRDDKNGYSITLSGTFHLDVDDTVHIGCNHGASVLDNHIWCSFTGFLVISDS